MVVKLFKKDENNKSSVNSNNPAITEERPIKKVLIIGAGVAGIQTAKALLQEGFKVLVVEREGDVGGVWMKNYVGFGLQVPWDLYQFPDFPYPEHLRPTQEYPTGSDVLAYVQAYARHFGLYSVIRFFSQVLQLRPLPNGAGWGALYVDTRSQQFFHVTVDFVVISSGIYSTPFLPNYEGSETFQGQQIHAKDFVELSLATRKRVVVVGAGKTALDCVANVASNKLAASVTLLYRQAHWPIPRRVFGTSIRRLLFNRWCSTMLQPYYDDGKFSQMVSGVTWPIKQAMWKLMELFISRKFQMTSELKPQVSLPKDLFYGGQILDDRFDQAICGGYVNAIRGEIHRFTRNGLILQDGSFLPADFVLYCTGYAKSYDILDGATRARLHLAKDGLYLYRNVLPPSIPNMAFIGSEVSTYNNILTHSLQAMWLSRVLTGQLKLPSVAEMEDDVRRQQAWRRQVMPPQRHRGSVLMLYMQQYHDQLLRDLRIPSRRKGINPLVECFGTYTAKDYGSLFDREEEDEEVVVDGNAKSLPNGSSGNGAGGVPANSRDSGRRNRFGFASSSAAAVNGGGFGSFFWSLMSSKASTMFKEYPLEDRERDLSGSIRVFNDGGGALGGIGGDIGGDGIGHGSNGNLREAHSPLPVPSPFRAPSGMVESPSLYIGEIPNNISQDRSPVTFISPDSITLMPQGPTRFPTMTKSDYCVAGGVNGVSAFDDHCGLHSMASSFASARLGGGGGSDTAMEAGHGGGSLSQAQRPSFDSNFDLQIGSYTRANERADDYLAMRPASMMQVASSHERETVVRPASLDNATSYGERLNGSKAQPKNFFSGKHGVGSGMVVSAQGRSAVHAIHRTGTGNGGSASNQSSSSTPISPLSGISAAAPAAGAGATVALGIGPCHPTDLASPNLHFLNSKHNDVSGSSATGYVPIGPVGFPTPHGSNVSNSGQSSPLSGAETPRNQSRRQSTLVTIMPATWHPALAAAPAEGGAGVKLPFVQLGLVQAIVGAVDGARGSC